MHYQRNAHDISTAGEGHLPAAHPGRFSEQFGDPDHPGMVRLVAWSICWTLLARWTPHFFQPYRRLLLTLFGAKVHPTAMVRGSAKVWWPGNLVMGERANFGPGVVCHNVSKVSVGDFAIVSQRAQLYTASPDLDDRFLRPLSKPIVIERGAWVAAEALVTPGVTVGEGAVLGARGVAHGDLDPWTVYVGDPAVAKRKRRGDSRATENRT